MSRTLAGLVVLLGGADLLAWFAGATPDMRANTAAALVALGVALRLALTRGVTRTVAGLCAVAALPAAASLLADFAGIDLGLDELLVRDPSAAPAVHPGRIPPNSAIALLLASAGVALLDRRIRGVRVASVLGVLAGTVAIVALESRLFDAPQVATGFVGRDFAPMAMLTAVALLAVATALLAPRADTPVVLLAASPSAGGVLVRRVLPVIVLAVPFLAWLRLEGQRLGLYGTEVGIALLSTSLMLILGLLLWRTASSLDRYEQRLAETEARQAATVQATPDGLVTIDVHGRIAAANPAAERLLGQTSGDLLGRRITDVVSGTNAVRRSLARLGHEELRKRMIGQPWELRLGRQGSRTVPVELTLSELSGGAEPVYLATLRDLTERVAAEATRRRLAAIVEFGSDAVVSLDPAGEAIVWNRAAERLARRAAGAEAVETREALARLVDTPELRSLRDAVVRDGAAPALHHAVGVGEERSELLVTAFALPDPSGDGTGVALVARDVTEERALEEQLRQAQKMEAVGQMAGGIAHDFNNLLTIILNYGELAERLIGAGPGGEEVGHMRTAARRAAELTRQLLAFSRRQVLDPVPLDVGDVVRGLVPMLRRLISEDVEIAVVAARRVGTVIADRGQLEQVLVNLALNARDAMPQGGTLSIAVDEVEVAPGDPRIGVELSPGRHVRVAVGDTGSGIPAELLERVFEPFFTTKPVDAGTGLGLSTAHGIVRQSGGALEVESTLGLGTTFSILLPVAGPPQERAPSADAGEAGGHAVAVAAAVDAPPSRADAVRVLVCEDDEMVRRLIARILTGAGMQVSACGSAADALAELDGGGGCDLLLTDVVMPDVSGPELAREVLARRPGLPVLYTSGYTADVVRRRADLGDDALLVEKPFDAATLLRAVRETLEISGTAGGARRQRS